MRNKGAIKLVAILLALVCVYQLSFTFVTARIEKKATTYAKGDPLKKIFYKDSVAGVPVYNFLWLKKYTYRQCQERELNLGLDLKGGMNVMLEVSVTDLVKGLSNNSSDATFNKALILAKQRQAKSQDDFVTLFGKAFTEIDPNAKLAAIFNTLQLRDKIRYNSTNEEVLKVLQAETKVAITNSVKILRARIDQFGVAQPNFQEMGTAGRVMIELPGIKDHDRVRKLLQVSAKLEFWETYENKEVFGFLQDANNKLAEIEKVSALPADTMAKKTVTPAVTDTTKANSLLDKLEKDTTKTSETKSLAEFTKKNPLFGLLRPNGSGNDLNPGPVVGYCHFRDTAKVNRILELPQVKNIFPTTLRLYWSAKPIDGNNEMFSLVAIKISNREGKPALDGAVVTNAQYDLGGSGNKPEVSLNMNNEGGKIWARLTKENINRSIAIVLDNYVRSNPTVQNEITGGRSSISGGGMTIEEAQDLANILNVGRMDAPAKITSEVTVGPSLGREAINSGLFSFVLAFLLVLMYMVLYYNRAGWIANIALVSNVFFIFGVMASLGAVLTLPGIAGIVLTLGMAVDANVIIYERIREELRAGKGIKLAVKEGYKHAMSAIIDGNVTTILTGVILYIFGSGPIRGFATTLVIGLLTSLFSAIFISRIIFEWLMDKEKKLNFGNKYTNMFLVNTHLHFIEKRKYMYIFSVTLMLISIGSLTFRGLNLGVDFKGGRSFTVRFDQPVSTEKLTLDITKACKGISPQVKTFGGSNQVKIITPYLVDNQDAATASIVEQAIFDGCKKNLAPSTDLKTFLEKNVQDSQLVGPTVAKDIMRGAILAVFFALIVMFLYILVRFNTWQMAVGAVASLFHDSIIVLGLYSLFYSIMPFSMEVDQAFIAAILTIIGYSINDTVIVFDRIREYKHLYKKRGQHVLFNDAVDSTLGRTLNTVGTVLVTLISMFILGGPSIRGFVFALLFGIAFGTYSSIFVASSIAYDMHRLSQRRKGLAENE